MSIAERTKTALDESRMLMLGAQILLGFQFQAPFQNVFEALSASEKAASMVALCIMIVVVGLLITPSARHRILEDGEVTPAVNRFITKIAFITLLPFAIALSLGFYVAGYRVGGTIIAMVSAIVGFVVAASLWYGPYLARSGIGDCGMEETCERASTQEKINFVLTEARVVLPGAQALLGFQLVIVLTSSFAEMPPSLKMIHGIAIASVALCTILLMTPAAYHRIIYDGASDPRFHHTASRFLLASTVFLAIGLAADLRVVVDKITGESSWATALAILSLGLLLGLWHLWPWAARQVTASRRA